MLSDAGKAGPRPSPLFGMGAACFQANRPFVHTAPDAAADLEALVASVQPCR